MRLAANPARDREYRAAAEHLFDRLHADLSAGRNVYYLSPPAFLIVPDAYGYEDLDIRMVPRYGAETRNGVLRVWREDGQIQYELILFLDDYHFDPMLSPLTEDVMLGGAAQIFASMHDTFVHEMIHYFDTKRYGESFFSDTAIERRQEERAEQGRFDPLSGPIEFNAWFQSITSRIEEETERLLWERPVSVLSRGGYMYDWDNFRLTLGSFLGRFDPDLLTEPYRRKLLSRFYAFYTDYRERVYDEIYPAIVASRSARVADARSDEKARRTAKEIWDGLQRFLTSPGANSDCYRIHPDLVTFAIDMGCVYPELEGLTLLFKEAGKSRYTGKLETYEDFDDSLYYEITINSMHPSDFVGPEGPREDLDSFLYRLIDQKFFERNESTFTHEFVHYLDALQYGDTYYSEESIRRKRQLVLEQDRLSQEERPEEAAGLYLSTPEEYNAWYQQHVAEFLRHVEEETHGWFSSVPDPDWYEDPHLFVDYALRYFFEESAKPWKTEILDPKFRRKLKKRLYGLWQHLNRSVLEDEE